MSLSGRLDKAYYEAKANKWFHYFAVFCRITLALAFIIAALVKITGERFAGGLSVNNPTGHYFEALYHTGYYCIIPMMLTTHSQHRDHLFLRC